MSKDIVTSLKNSARERYRAIIVNMECQRDTVGSGFSDCGVRNYHCVPRET